MKHQFPNDEPAFDAAKRRQMLEEMQATSDRFYRSAARIGCHAYIEFCGLMNKYIDVCRRAEAQGVDWLMANTHTGAPLPFENHDLVYLAEKLSCIYGPALQGDKGRVLVEAMGLLDPAVRTSGQLAAHEVQLQWVRSPWIAGVSEAPPWCSSRGSSGYCCTLTEGHKGDHVAGNGDGSVVERWRGASVSQALEALEGVACTNCGGSFDPRAPIGCINSNACRDARLAPRHDDDFELPEKF